MINLLIIYGFVMGAILRGIHHGRLVVPGNTRPTFLQSLFAAWFRITLIAAIVIQGIRAYGIIPDSYRMWWDSYFVEHSLGAWIALVGTITMVLYILKGITYSTSKDPHGYQMYDPGTGVPTLLRTSMATSTCWFLIYWTWILASPWLPFYSCFVKVFLFGNNPAAVFSVS